MAHYKQLLDPAKYLGPVDFPTEREVTISRIVREKLPSRDDDKEPPKSAPMLYINGKDGKEYARPLKVPKTVLYGLALMLGVDHDKWLTQKIIVFATRCMAFGEIEECLRVRFPAEIETKVKAWLKKRKASPSAYMIADKP